MTTTFTPAVLRGVEFGTGRPKVCIPIMPRGLDDVRPLLDAVTPGVADLIELRVDHFDGIGDLDEVRELVRATRVHLVDAVPLLFTFRSKPEGGERDIDPVAYEQLLAAATDTGDIDALDVEMFTELGSLERLVNGAHEVGVAVIMSSHDFEHTPTVEQIVARLSLQQDLGADVVKIAVMPSTAADVLTLLQATEEFVRTKAFRPAMTMSMGALGVVSRLAGETFGSCATFGAVGATSAPGQVDATELRRVLDLVHGA